MCLNLSPKEKLIVKDKFLKVKMYLSAFYSLDLPQTYLKIGSYDIGCGGFVWWVITTEKPSAVDIFCVPYRNQRLAVIFQPWFSVTTLDVTDKASIAHDIKKFKACQLESTDAFLAWFDNYSLSDLIEGYSDGEYYVLDLEKEHVIDDESLNNSSE